MSKMQACYEKHSNGRWQLVVHHNGIFNDPLNKITRYGSYDVPPEFIGSDGSPNLGAIRLLFPEPMSENDG